MLIRAGLVFTLLCIATPAPRALAQDLSPASVAQQSIDAEAGQPEVSRQTRGKRSRPGYGVAAGLGIALGGLIVAAQARPNVESTNLCYDNPARERRFLYASSGVMVSGLVLAGGMLVRLLRVRAAHPDVEPSSRARWGHALLGFGLASVMTTSLMATTVGCASS